MLTVEEYIDGGEFVPLEEASKINDVLAGLKAIGVSATKRVVDFNTLGKVVVKWPEKDKTMTLERSLRRKKFSIDNTKETDRGEITTYSRKDLKGEIKVEYSYVDGYGESTSLYYTGDVEELVALGDTGGKPASVKLKATSPKLKRFAANIQEMGKALKSLESKGKMSPRHMHHFGKWDDAEWDKQILDHLASMASVILKDAGVDAKFKDIAKHFSKDIKKIKKLDLSKAAAVKKQALEMAEKYNKGKK